MLKLYVLNFNRINPLVDFIKGSFTIVSFVYKLLSYSTLSLIHFVNANL